jgi:triacylglycerol lipase
MRLRLATFIVMCSISATRTLAQEHVVLLHGLCRSSRSMEPMRRALVQAGYCVTNVNFPSRHGTVEALSESAIGSALEDCRRRGAAKVHFVTHSLGGILVRSYFARHAASDVGRVVMLGPPNGGSEVVDRLGASWLFSLVNGPAGRELGTRADSLPNRLGPPKFYVGVVAGDRSINWINSLLIPGLDDGKVSVERTKLAGMADHIVVHATHPLMMRKREVICQTIEFLRKGNFDHSRPKPGTPNK